MFREGGSNMMTPDLNLNHYSLMQTGTRIVVPIPYTQTDPHTPILFA